MWCSGACAYGEIHVIKRFMDLMVMPNIADP